MNAFKHIRVPATNPRAEPMPKSKNPIKNIKPARPWYEYKNPKFLRILSSIRDNRHSNRRKSRPNTITYNDTNDPVMFNVIKEKRPLMPARTCKTDSNTLAIRILRSSFGISILLMSLILCVTLFFGALPPPMLSELMLACCIIVVEREEFLECGISYFTGILNLLLQIPLTVDGTGVLITKSHYTITNKGY